MVSAARPIRIAVFAAVAGAIAAAAAQLRRRRGAHAGRESPREPVPDFRCVCGQGFRVAGRDRHTVYWVAGAPESEPLLGTQCPHCERELPAVA